MSAATFGASFLALALAHYDRNRLVLAVVVVGAHALAVGPHSDTS